MVYLGKWPTMVVVGDPITAEQANEVLIRTLARDYYDQTNDREWGSLVRDIVGTEDAHFHGGSLEDGMATFDRNQDRLDALGVLNLEFLNNSRIASAYIGGPHGWLNWDGNISHNEPYNIGKWPEEVDLVNEWAVIAEAFPFLNLRAQFYSEDADEIGNLTYLMEITVADGKASITHNPQFSEDDINYPNHNPASVEFFLSRMGRGYTERGVSEERLREAVTQVEVTRGL